MVSLTKERPMRPEPANGPDFSEVDSREKAEALHRTGVLAKLLLLAERFGGRGVPENVVYVPSWVVHHKARIDENVIVPLVASGTVTRYEAVPQYQGKSFVPIGIRITATEPGQFSATINIWGEALSRSGAK
jgi:hypothetical protein